MSRLLLLLALAPLCLSTAALADPPAEALARAKVHFEAGTRHYDLGAYDEAAGEFQKAYALSEHPELLYNVYTAYERGGRYGEAADALARYLELGTMEPEQRTSLETRLASLRARVEREQAEVASEPAPEPPSIETPPPAKERKLPKLAIASYAVAGGMAATFGVFAGLALAERGSLEDGCGATQSCTADDVRKQRAFNITADVALAAGVTALATALISTFVGRDEPPKVEVSFFGDRESRGLVLRGRF